ncbi:hypothetical protein AGOR_G00031950 [Albula goreensis]|uniref:Rho-GAP domain-containing protein n=1 Tax=Albula goreensis TaxID=1534307 RepID=A0A8T3DXW9_9TELE|nr:hypothetical protein AGOR_G00031950 [Albula goreensis]
MRRGRRKGASKDKVFGCDLLEHLAASSQEIPQVLRCCSEFIEEHGIVDGIYRLSGVSSNIQKLRSEFDGEGTPDLCKDVYLQDIHCISSLCKAYFRELPNPLLTYQLYDKFADAVAVQLEEERLVKIKEVLKDLPPPHYRTLEFLMRHLVKMSTFALQTNMHARNLAIVWAPNLLRSKDIEASGFNGTAAFMEVRVQSIVVEFILTHVTQLFPIPGQPSERRKSLPSPSVMANQEDQFFRTVPLQLPSALSPGDGPPPMRPYHSIIESTDKRKGSLKGRKWKSIFNLGGRLQDPRRKNKVTCKDKEKVSLRPAKSMDSLSSVPYSHEGDRAHPSPSPPLGREAGSSGGVMGGAGSAYAVTYRRGGGASVSVVSGGGTQGTYSRLDSGGGSTADGLPPPRSPGLSSRAERRAGIHISGPFSVTVPLHITSGLALGVLQGGVQREEDRTEKEVDGAENDEGGVQKEEGGAQREEGGALREEGGAQREEGRNQREEGEALREEGGALREEGRKVGKEVDGAEMEGGRVKIEVCMSEKEESREWREGEKHREERKEGAVERKKGENRIVEGEDRCSDAMGIKESLSVEEEQPAASPGAVKQGLEEEEPDYMDMRAGTVQIPLDEQLPLDFQDTFGFLDLMDNSTYNQVNEFSVEPPCYEEEEDDEEQSGYLGGAPSAQSPQWSAPPIQTHRSVTFDPNSRACKSHSLPYKSQSFLPAISFSSSEDEDDGSEEEDGSDEENGRFFCSLPDSLQFQALIQRDMARDANAGDLSSPDLHAAGQESTGTNGHDSSDSSTCGGLQAELESSLPLMDMDRAGGEGGFSDRKLRLANGHRQTRWRTDRLTLRNTQRWRTDRLTQRNTQRWRTDRLTQRNTQRWRTDRLTQRNTQRWRTDRPHTEEHTKVEDRPTHTEEHTKVEDRPPHTEEHTKMEDRPTHTEEHTKVEDRPTHTEEHTKVEDRPPHTEEHTNTPRAERNHVATWTDTPGLGCGEAEASLTESEEEYEEDENPSVLEHREGNDDSGERPPFENKLFEDECNPQPTPAGEEQVTEPTPAGHPEEQVAQPTPVEEEKKQETGPTPAGDPEELREQHRCGHSDEELSGLEFVVKAEQEEEHVAQRLSQTGCEHSAGRLNNLGSEYVMYERDSQLWTSFTQGDSDIETADPVCSNATEQYSQSLSVHSELQHTPATVEGSGNTVSSFGASYVEAFDKMREKCDTVISQKIFL